MGKYSMPAFRHLIVMAVGCTVLPACATVTRGVNDTLIIETDPPGATVTTDRKMGTYDDGKVRFAGCDATPCTIKMPRRSEFLMTIEKDGYEPVEIGVSGSMKRETLRSNLSSAGKTGIAVGVTSTMAFASFASSFGVSTGSMAAAGTATAGVATLGIFGATLLVDGASGAMLNLNPNPIILQLPPEGTVVPLHNKAVAIREKRGEIVPEDPTPSASESEIEGGAADIEIISE